MEKMEESSETNSRSVREMSITDFPLFPRDLLRRFTPARSDLNEQTQNAAVAGDGDEDEEGDEEEGGVELNLGLSLGGRFGIESSSGNPNRLKRSSSIAGTMPTFREEKSSGAAAAAMETPPVAAHTATGLMRTTSLPVGTEEEWKKRKEMQSLRRKEAKRRRSEKQRNHGNADRSSCRGLPRWSAGVNKAGILQKSRERISLDSHGGDYGGGGGGGSSSSLSEFDSKCVQGSNNNSNGRSHVANQPSQEADGTSSAKTPNSTRRAGNTLRRLSSVDLNLQVKEEEEEDNMPCVFTRGEGPDGRRVDGILYRYGRGEDVRIMCVCHGDFLSPAEFVRHAGGGEVDHPLRHIVVNAPAAAATAATAATAALFL